MIQWEICSFSHLDAKFDIFVYSKLHVDFMMWIRTGGNFVHFHILISNFDISLYSVGWRASVGCIYCFSVVDTIWW
jgi:hypothetical protein